MHLILFGGARKQWPTSAHFGENTADAPHVHGRGVLPISSTFRSEFDFGFYAHLKTSAQSFSIVVNANRPTRPGAKKNVWGSVPQRHYLVCVSASNTAHKWHPTNYSIRVCVWVVDRPEGCITFARECRRLERDQSPRVWVHPRDWSTSSAVSDLCTRREMQRSVILRLPKVRSG